MMNAMGVSRPVITPRSTSAIAIPATHVYASMSQRFDVDVYRRSVSATPNQPTRNGQSTVRYQPTPELMS